MKAHEKRKAERLDAIVEFLHHSTSRKNSHEILAKLSALNMNVSACTVQENLRQLVAASRIHFIVEQRIGSSGVPMMLYGYGASPDDAIWPHETESAAACTWLGPNEWKRGQHGRDLLQAALFGEVRA